MSGVGFMGGGGISDRGFRNVAGGMANGTYFAVSAPDVRKLGSAEAFVRSYNAPIPRRRCSSRRSKGLQRRMAAGCRRALRL